MNPPMPARTRSVRLALAIAIVADLIQIPTTLAMLASAASGFGMLAEAPLEGVSAAIDLVVSVIEIRLLGFHWVLLPSAVIKLIPVVDLAPTWTLSVLYLARKLHRADQHSEPVSLR